MVSQGRPLPRPAGWGGADTAPSWGAFGSSRPAPRYLLLRLRPRPVWLSGAPLCSAPTVGGRPCLGLRMLILGPETHLPRMPGEASPRPRHVPLQVGLSLRSWPGPQLRPHPEASFEPRALSGQGRPCWEATGRSRRTPDHRPGDWARPHASPGDSRGKIRLQSKQASR